MKSLALGVLAALVAGCQPTFSDLRQEVNRGVGGYTGLVTPFTVPVLLRYQGGTQADMESRWSSSASGQRQSGSLRGSVTVQAIGEQRLWEIQVTETTIDNKVQRSIRPPLMSARGLSDARGPLKDIDLAFPAFSDQQVREMKEQAPHLVEVISNKLRFSMVQLPERPIQNGDDFLSAQDFLLEMLVAEFGAAATRDEIRRRLVVRSNSLFIKVVGQTIYKGRQMLVLGMGGAADITLDEISSEFSLTGHWLVDMKSGLTGHMFGVAESTVRRRNQVSRHEGSFSGGYAF